MLWCPCSPSSVNWFQLASRLGQDNVSISATQSHSGEHLVAKRLYAIRKYVQKKKIISFFDTKRNSTTNSRFQGHTQDREMSYKAVAGMYLAHFVPFSRFLFLKMSQDVFLRILIFASCDILALIHVFIVFQE